jgi:dTDP-4-amino-4,6-dideoxygalactose transaminase
MPDIIKFNQSYLPPFNEVNDLLASAWLRNEVTNNGELVRKLEDELKAYLGVKHVFAVNSGTTGLLMALVLLEKKGEVITTPFTFIATSASIIWQNLTPVFVDIDPVTFCIDASKIEAAITEKTIAILPTHVFGNICNVKDIEKIAVNNNLTVIYDAAHTFGTKYNGKHACAYGDISVLSFHAYKVFNTIEGGALVTDDDKLADKIYKMRYFGIGDEYDVTMLGINAKMSELHAAVGLCSLKYVQPYIAKKLEISTWYKQELKDAGLGLSEFVQEGLESNYSYFYILFKTEGELNSVKQALFDKGVLTKRYFYPPLNKIDFIGFKGEMPVSEDIAKRILHLPAHNEISLSDVKRITNVIKTTLNAC